MSCGEGDMSVEATKDSGIKLFGRTIPLPESQIPAKSQLMDDCSEITKAEVENSCAEISGELEKSSALGDGKREQRTSMQVNEAPVNPKTKDTQVETNITDQEKVFKKPDKIVQCPRCNSLDTKFCYFNNYNVNQPRHFCKNCQRYWTAGGTMRNVPVGAGRRKNKHLVSQYRQIIVSSDGVPTTSLEAPDSANHQLVSCGESSAFTSSTGSGTVLKFGPEAPLCESMETVLNLREQKRCVEMGSVNFGENGEEPSSCGSSMTASSSQGNQLPENVVQREKVGLPASINEHNTPHPLHRYPVPPWAFPWNAGLQNVASMPTAHHTSERIVVPNGGDPNQVQWYPTPMLAVPGFCPPSIPLQLVPASYWGCMPVWGAGAGNISFTGSNGCLSSSSSTSNKCCSGNGSPTLGKHSRDVKFVDEEKSETCILVPKTLRIDDPGEASKSPIWATLGIKCDQKESLSKSTIFETFEPNAEGKDHLAEASQILGSNPAALSRSHTFQEST